MHDAAIIGGGLAGLTSAVLLARQGHSVMLFEEKTYPFHRVCGEYISNEVIPFLQANDLYPEALDPVAITNFNLTSTGGKKLSMKLDLGGFGISRYSFDAWLAEKARLAGVDLREGERVTAVNFQGSQFTIRSGDEMHEAKVVIGAFGKRSMLDRELKRKFLTRKSPYVGVKYHIKTNMVPDDTIELHNFSGGYCGISRVENRIHNLCYLTHRDNTKAHGDIQKMEETVLHRNPHLKEIFTTADFLFDKPEVIGEITFEKKEPVFDHMLMSGDSAGMIAPLCGNGMAMAIHSAKILSELSHRFLGEEIDRIAMEQHYQDSWNKMFGARLWAGRRIQGLFGSGRGSGFAVALGKTIPPAGRYLMSLTHGKRF